ncbi:MAG TPA: NusA-like transcription termination signal-binding factor [Acidobacteriota bacterium]|nr:NusA-like transcription termination signal-binding factor [Acidobacteriota bacterium]
MNTPQIKFTQETMQSMSAFENLTGAKVKDCFDDSQGLLTFIIEHNDIRKALGKNATNVLRARKTFNRNLRVIEFNPDVVEFIKNVARPVILTEVQTTGTDGIYVMVAPDMRSRGYLIGRNAQALRNNESVVQRYFPVKELKVVLSPNAPAEVMEQQPQ